MGCSECGEKPKTCNKDFTKSVIEIDNPAEIILFHKVLIPASMGDESQTPVTIGKYKNVLMVYEANGHAYLYSSDGIPSKIAFDSGGILFVENLPDVHEASVGFLYITHTGSAAITNDNEEWVSLGGQGTMDFNALSNRPKYADVEMTGDTNIPSVEDETAARIAADNALSAAIESETSARSLADNIIQNNITNEATNRANADTVIEGKIAALDNSLATVAKTGDYDDLTNKPTIGDGVITFTENNVVKGTFSANATGNKTIEFPVPTQTSQLTNNGSDGTSTYVETKDLPTVDTTYDIASGNAIANSTVTNSLDRQVMTNLVVDSNPSTTTVKFNNTKTNLANPSSTTTSDISLPVASSTQAGVMNSAMYDALTKNTQDIANIMGEVVAITGLPDNPTQAQLTTAWLNASGEPALINGAGIYDVTNAKRWTYYSNDNTWHALDASGSVTVNPWSNTAAGIVKGSTNVGQIFAENDGTGSVNGWDTLTATVGDHTSKLATIEQGAEVNVQADWAETVTTADDYIKNKPQNLVSDASYVHTDNNFTTSLKNKLDGIAAGAEVNVQSNWTQTDTTADDYIKNKPTIPTVNNATLTVQQNGGTLGTFTANSSTDTTVNVQAPKRVGPFSQTDIHRFVIGLCEVNTSNTEQKDSYSMGTIYFKRDNGSGGDNLGKLDIQMCPQYHVAKSVWVKYESSWRMLNPSEDIDAAAVGWRPCVFKYNDKWYGGVEGVISVAETRKWFHGESNITPFQVYYYKVPYSGAASSIVNQEIYDSIIYSNVYQVASSGNITNYLYNLDLKGGRIYKNSTYTLELPNKNGTLATTADTGNQPTWCGTSSEAGTATVLTSAISGFALTTGARVSIKFSNGHTATGVTTLNVNGTGAKTIVRESSSSTDLSYMWAPNEVVDFVYDGTNYVLVDGMRATTSYYGPTKLSDATNSTSTSLAATANAVKKAYDYAGSSTVGTSRISNGAVTSDKIDYTTLTPILAQVPSIDIALTDSTSHTITTANITGKGDYIILAQTNIDTLTVQNDGYYEIGLWKGSQLIAQDLYDPGRYNRTSTFSMGWANFTTNDTISLTITAHDCTGTVRGARCRLAAFRAA